MVAFPSPQFRRNAFSLAGFVSKSQEQKLLRQMNMPGGEAVTRLVAEMAERIASMSATYSTSKVSDPICWLRYTTGRLQVFITEKDAGCPGDDEDDFQRQAFGFNTLFPESHRSLGYISIPEILEAGAELDLNFVPTPRSVIHARIEAS